MKINSEFAAAITKLISSVIYAECTIAGSRDGDGMVGTVDAARAVLREILADEELSSLHKWANRQLNPSVTQVARMQELQVLAVRKARARQIAPRN